MVRLTNGYYITSDGSQYTLYEQHNIIGKDGKEKKVESMIGYFSSIGAAIRKALSHDIAREISENDMDFSEAVDMIERKHEEFERLLAIKTHKE